MALQRIAAVDDAHEGLLAFEDSIGDVFDAQAILIQDTPVTAQALIERVRREHIDGVLVDYKLNTRGYSRFDGIDIVAALTQARIPAVLATSYSRIDRFVWHGRHVPAIIQKGDLRNTLSEAFESACARVEGRFTAATEPYPTLIRVASLDADEVGLLIPSFGQAALLVSRRELAERLGRLELAVGLRFEADVNIGAPNLDSLYVNAPRPLPDLDPRYAALLHS